MIKKIKNNGAIGEGEAAVNILLFYSSRRIASVFTASLLFPPSVRQSVSSIVLVGSLPKLLVLLNLFLADALALARTVQLPSQPKYSLYCLRSSAAVSVFFVCCPAPPEITTTTTTREPYGSLRITVTTVTPSTPPSLSYIVSQTS